jgi:hypothetical protein
MDSRLVDVVLGLPWLLAGAALVVLYIAFFPDQASKVFGMLLGLIGRLLNRADRAAVALRVQGDVNSARADLLRNAPDIVDRKLKIKWTDAVEAEAALTQGEVIVFMKPSRDHSANVATALMAYLPKAVISRARRYVGRETMQAADLTLAKAVILGGDNTEHAIDTFYERYFDPAREGSEALRQRLVHMDRIDMHGWLSRILLNEYRRLGDALHPGDPDEECLREAEEFADWLAELANLAPGELGSLRFAGRYISVAVVFVALRQVLEERGVEPYRKRAKRHIYTHRHNSVYLLARDRNIEAVDELIASLEGDAIITCSDRYTYALRSDFKARVLNRDRAVCACLRRKQGAAELVEDADSAETAIPDEVFTPQGAELAAVTPNASSESDTDTFDDGRTR